MVCLISLLTLVLTSITTILVIFLLFCIVFVYQTLMKYRTLLETSFPSLVQSF
jgi:hypothetical protein